MHFFYKNRMSNNSLVTPEMKFRYLTRRLEELALAEQKMSAFDFDYFKNIGHQIKGNAVTFEFPSLTSFGVSLENYAGQKDLGKVASLAKDLKLAVQGLLDRIEKDKPNVE